MAQPTPTETARAIQRDGRWAIRAMQVFCRLDLPSAIDVPADRPMIACGNHQSLLDVFCAAAFCAGSDVSCRFFVNARYFKNPAMGRWLRRIGSIPLDSATRDEAFATARASLARRELVGIMPEGRLTPPEQRDPQVGVLRPGAAELAYETGAVLAPIMFHNTGTVWPRDGFPRPRLRRPLVTVKLSDERIEPSGDHAADMEKVGQVLTGMLDEHDRTLRDHTESG